MTDVLPQIVTDRLVLRSPESADAPAMSRLVTPAVARWVASWPCPFTPDMARERIAGALRWAADHRAAPFVVTHKDDGTLMGWIGVTKTAGDRGTLGYWLGAEFHGQGYMREAAPPALRAGFDWLDVQVIDAMAQLANAPSFAVMKACGMKYIEDRMVFAPSRGVEEMCGVYEARRD